VKNKDGPNMTKAIQTLQSLFSILGSMQFNLTDISFDQAWLARYTKFFFKGAVDGADGVQTEWI